MSSLEDLKREEAELVHYAAEIEARLQYVRGQIAATEGARDDEAADEGAGGVVAGIEQTNTTPQKRVRAGNRDRRGCNVDGCTRPADKEGLCYHHHPIGRPKKARVRKSCSRADCNRAAQKDGLCYAHHPTITPKNKTICSAEGCERVGRGCIPGVAGMRCSEHGYKQKRNTRQCQHEGCQTGALAGGLCFKHGGGPGLCSTDGCTNRSQSGKGGVCIRHGAERKFCKHPSCTNHQQGGYGGYCKRHWKIQSVRQG